MDDFYVECLVAKKPVPFETLIKGLAWGVAALCFLLGVINIIFMIPFILIVIANYFLLPKISVEYEYLYVSRSLQIDRIFSKQNRKKAIEYDLEQMEIFAEEGAWQLDEYKNMQTVNRDFTSGLPDRDIWILIVHNGQQMDRVRLEPNAELIQAMKSVYPRKTFAKT
ncbi:MAG: DUF6106 family protein [Lachnospiraceae bacterium]|nr:DUF6106 family protein [Lachnospiraceae bacterium]